MNKIGFLIVGLVSFVPISYTYNSANRPDSQPNKKLSGFKGFIRDLDDFVWTERLGYKAVSEKNEKFIRDIAHELAMDDYCIEIRGMNNVAKLKYCSNAFVYLPIFFSVMYFQSDAELSNNPIKYKQMIAFMRIFRG